MGFRGDNSTLTRTGTNVKERSISFYCFWTDRRGGIYKESMKLVSMLFVKRREGDYIARGLVKFERVDFKNQIAALA